MLYHGPCSSLLGHAVAMLSMLWSADAHQGQHGIHLISVLLGLLSLLRVERSTTRLSPLLVSCMRRQLLEGCGRLLVLRRRRLGRRLLLPGLGLWLGGREESFWSQSGRRAMAGAGRWKLLVYSMRSRLPSGAAMVLLSGIGCLAVSLMKLFLLSVRKLLSLLCLLRLLQLEHGRGKAGLKAVGIF